jgi:hypothetical protein
MFHRSHLARMALAGCLAALLAQPAVASSQNTTSVLGIEAAALTPNHVSLISEAGAGWARRNALLWSDVEPREGERNWAAVSSLEQELRNAASRGLKTILVVRSTPAWAQKYDGVMCGPVREDKLPAFGLFMRDVAARYAGLSFDVAHFEIGNEPDIAPNLVPPDNIFGCWGDEGDPYYGGGYYARALKAAYPQIKRANAGAQVLIGGLLLDCNPNQPKPGAPCVSGRFLEGILRAGGGDYFDIISVHAYDFWTGDAGFANAKWQSSSATTGPSIIAKTRFIRQLLARYGQPKPVMNTESAVLCWDCGSLPQAYMQTRAYYAAQGYAVARAQRLAANIWYSLEGWFGTSLLAANGEGNETLRAMTIAHDQMGSATTFRQINRHRGVRIYEFAKGDKRSWMVWSATGKPVALRLPVMPAQVMDVFGVPIDASTTLQLDAKPLYVTW